MSRKALLQFQQPETSVQVEISIQRWPHKQETTAMIRRVVEHPWAPAEAAELVDDFAGEEEKSKPRITRIDTNEKGKLVKIRAIRDKEKN